MLERNSLNCLFKHGTARNTNPALVKSQIQLAVWVTLKIFRKFWLKAHYIISLHTT